MKYLLSRDKKAFSAVLSIPAEQGDLFDHTIYFPPNNVREERMFQQAIQRETLRGGYRRRRRKNIKESPPEVSNQIGCLQN